MLEPGRAPGRLEAPAITSVDDVATPRSARWTSRASCRPRTRRSRSRALASRPRIPRREYGGVRAGLEGTRSAPGSKGLRAIVSVDIPEPGLYTVSAFPCRGAGQRWAADGCRKEVVCPSSKGAGWRSIMTQPFSAGRHTFAVTLRDGAALERLRLERKKDKRCRLPGHAAPARFRSGPRKVHPGQGGRGDELRRESARRDGHELVRRRRLPASARCPRTSRRERGGGGRGRGRGGRGRRRRRRAGVVNPPAPRPGSAARSCPRRSRRESPPSRRRRNVRSDGPLQPRDEGGHRQARLLRAGPVREDHEPPVDPRTGPLQNKGKIALARHRGGPDALLRLPARRARHDPRDADPGADLHRARPGLLRRHAKDGAEGRGRGRLRGGQPGGDAGRQPGEPGEPPPEPGGERDRPGTCRWSSSTTSATCRPRCPWTS